MIWFVAAIIGLFIAPRVTAAFVTAGVVMFLYIWIFNPDCEEYAKLHPEWQHQTCGLVPGRGIGM